METQLFIKKEKYSHKSAKRATKFYKLLLLVTIALFSALLISPVMAEEYGTVNVRIDEGAITVLSSGDGSYYLGEEVTFSGTNTDTNDLYLFITGPNLPLNGGVLTDPQTPVSTDPTSPDNTHAAVKTDDTWEYKWNTSGALLDAATYTIYATANPVNKSLLSLTKYDTVSIVLEKPFVTATVSSSTILKGDDLYIRGTATGDPPSGVAIWIFGKNYWNGAAVPMQYSGMVTETVNDDNSFEYLLESAETKNLSAGQYYVVVQHPMYNGQFDVITDAEEQWVIVKDRLNIYYNSFVVWGVGYLQGSDASEALIDGINSPYVDDTYYKLSFIVENPWIKIDSISDHHAGDLFTISGTTNLDVGTEIVIALTDSFFQVSEEKTDDFSNISSTVQVVEGINYNEWSLDIDTSDFSENNYKVQAESIEFNVSATANFSIINSSIPIPTPTPTPVKPVSKDIGAAIVSASASPDKSEYEIKEPVCIKANAELESSGDQTFPAPHSLKAYTELDNPEWHYIIKINGHGEEQVTKGKNLIISGYLLEYPSDKNEIKIEYLLEGNIPEINEISNQTLIGLSQIDSSGNIASSGPFLLQRTVYPDLPDPQYKYEKIILNNGWNFISTPKKLDPSGGNNTAGKLFGNVDSGGHSALMYNGSNGGWDAVKADTIIKPLDALWIYSNSTENQDIYLTFDSNPLQTPPSKHLSAGWNTLGYSSTKSATTRDTLIDVSEKWTKVIGWDAEEQNFEDTIISGGSGNYADSRSMLPGKGYWVWMKDEGTIASLAINSMEV